MKIAPNKQAEGKRSRPPTASPNMSQKRICGIDRHPNNKAPDSFRRVTHMHEWALSTVLAASREVLHHSASPGLDVIHIAGNSHGNYFSVSCALAAF